MFIWEWSLEFLKNLSTLKLIISLFKFDIMLLKRLSKISKLFLALKDKSFSKAPNALSTRMTLALYDDDLDPECSLTLTPSYAECA